MRAPVGLGLAGSILALVLALLWADQVATAQGAAADAAASEDFVSVVVELSAAPAAQVYAALPPPTGELAAAQRSAATRAQVAAIDQAQLAVQAALEELGAQTLYRAQRVYNGIAVRVPRQRLDAVRALPGVAAVHPLIAKQPANQVSVPSIGAPALWGGLPGITGRGVTIAIIDTGVDYVHTDLGGPGTGYDQNDPVRIGDVPGFPNDKVIAGYDFAGDDYNADPRSAAYQPVPQPDPDPMDCYGFGHGTHVAGTAAGYGVLPDGARYPGPYDATTPQRAFQIGPGVAPEASVVALKVFGCHGSSEIVDMAIEWAVDPDGDGDFSDRVDVINLSLGSPLGAVDDPTAVAANNAARLGVVVVTSAGNSGDTAYAISSPSVADRAVSVAAVGRELPAQIVGFSARGPRRGDAGPKPELAAPGEGIVSASLGGGTHTASGTSMAAPHVAGAMALLRQVHPASPMTAAAQPATADGSARAWTVEELKALAMNTALHPLTTTVSGGIAPVNPVRAGAGRLDLVTAARAEVIAYNADLPGLVGVGFGAPEVLVGLSSVRNVRVANKGTLTATYAVGYAQVVDLPGVAIGVMGSSTITVPPGGFATLSVVMTAVAEEMRHGRDPALAAEQSGLPRAWLAEEAGYLELSPTAASLNAAGAHPPLHLPVYAAPRPASRLAADGALLDFGDTDTGEAELRFAGQALHGSSPPTGVVSLASMFELQLASGLEPPPEGSTRQYPAADLHYVGVTAVQPAAPSGVGGATILFGVATHEPWDTPHVVRFHIYIDTDLDGEADYRLRNSDAVDDDAQRTVNDVFLAVLETWPARVRVAQEFLNGASAAELDTGLHNSRLMVLPVRAAALGLGNGATRFRYFVESYALDVSDAVRRGAAVERTPVYAYDVSAPGLRFPAGLGSSAPHEVDSGTRIPVDFDRAAYRQAGSRGLLVFHLHNLDEVRAQVVPVRFVAHSTLYLPLVRR